PYSGQISASQAAYYFDGHFDHVGAWSADAFYGTGLGTSSVLSAWTDSATASNTYRSRNNNHPEDGKFDQTYLPSADAVPVGRIDFSDLTSLRSTLAGML